MNIRNKIRLGLATLGLVGLLTACSDFDPNKEEEYSYPEHPVITESHAGPGFEFIDGGTAAEEPAEQKDENSEYSIPQCTSEDIETILKDMETTPDSYKSEHLIKISGEESYLNMFVPETENLIGIDLEAIFFIGNQPWQHNAAMLGANMWYRFKDDKLSETNFMVHIIKPYCKTEGATDEDIENLTNELNRYIESKYLDIYGESIGLGECENLADNFEGRLLDNPEVASCYQEQFEKNKDKLATKWKSKTGEEIAIFGPWDITERQELIKAYQDKYLPAQETQ